LEVADTKEERLAPGGLLKKREEGPKSGGSDIQGAVILPQAAELRRTPMEKKKKNPRGGD